MNQELILILKQIANSHENIRYLLCHNRFKCGEVYCGNCIAYAYEIEYQPYAIDLGEPNE